MFVFFVSTSTLFSTLHLFHLARHGHIFLITLFFFLFHVSFTRTSPLSRHLCLHLFRLPHRGFLFHHFHIIILSFMSVSFLFPFSFSHFFILFMTISCTVLSLFFVSFFFEAFHHRDIVSTSFSCFSSSCFTSSLFPLPRLIQPIGSTYSTNLSAIFNSLGRV